MLWLSGGQVYLSTRRGAWILSRIGKGGMPSDMEGLRRSHVSFHKLLPQGAVNTLLEYRFGKRINHAHYSLKPDHGVLSAHPTVNDELPNNIISGNIVIKPNVESITETGVEFEDGSFEDKIDTIIYATGYKFGFPFIEHPGLEVTQNEVNLYKYMFPPDMTHHSLAVVGFVQSWGAINPIAELQCRLACRVFKVGSFKLSLDNILASCQIERRLRCPPPPITSIKTNIKSDVNIYALILT